MPLLVIDPGEVFGTNRAVKRLLAGVSSYVGGQLLLGEKRFRTLWAFVGENIQMFPFPENQILSEKVILY